MAENSEEQQPIIVKKIKKGGDGHHGGAWKVAYADFVTAMMAFFLLMWLLNMTPQEQLTALAHYYDPVHPKVSDSQSGAGGVLGGLTMSPEGAMASASQPVSHPRQNNTPRQMARQPDIHGGSDSTEMAKEILKREEEKKFEETKEAIERAIQESPELREMANNLIVDMTPEGLRIQVVDEEGRSMFPSGSAQMFELTEQLLRKIAEIVEPLPNELSVRGHTDATQYAPGATYTNWELSADRANASRRVLLDAGLPPERLNNVVGKADTDPLLPDDPTNARNRRISIILLKEELTNPEYDQKAAAKADELGLDEQQSRPLGNEPPPIEQRPFRRTEGDVEFP